MTTRLGHYDIVEELGRGGMGVVYKGYESSLGRYVAIKVLSAAMAHDKVFVERFLREARAMATLNDSHIVQIYFIGQDEAQTFFVMEYIDGESLSNILKREGRLPAGDALKILLHASQGLAAAHAQGVIHRDVKPGNIMVSTRGQVKVGDFGIALANHDASSKLTNTGAFVGTPGYLSPELCLGKAVDQRSDVFALGIVLFEMLSGQMPFQDDSPLRLMLDVVQADTPDIRTLNAGVDDEIVRILGRMLAKDPGDRYQSCEELNADLKQHPLVSAGGQLGLRPAPSAGAGASRPTVVGAPTPLTPGNLPRAATPPPVVSSARTPLMAQPTARPTLPATRSLALVAGVLGVALLGWVIGRAGPGKAPVAAPVVDASIAAPARAAALTPPVPPAPPAPASASASASASAPTPAPPAESLGAGNAVPPLVAVDAAVVDAAAVDAAADDADDPDAAVAVATVRYGHGGENGRVNRIRVRPEKEKSAAELAREQARKQDLAAALAAAEAQSLQASEASAAGGNPAGANKRRRGFLCRVFKKCDPAKQRPSQARPAGSGG